MYDQAWIGLIIVAMKMSSYYSIIVMFDVKDMTFESINDSIFCLTYIPNVAPFAFQAIYEIVTLACAFGNGVVLLLRFVIFPDWDNLVQYWQVLGLVQPLVVWVFGCGILALTNMSFNEGGFLYVTICLGYIIL